MDSKTYKFGQDKFWFLVKHPLHKELGLTAPSKHPWETRFNHERTCGDLFASLASTAWVSSDNWYANKKLSTGYIPDRAAMFDSMYYFEVQLTDPKAIEGKIKQYQAHFRATRESFHVVFLVPSESFDTASQIVSKTTSHYQVVELDEFLLKPFDD